MSEFTQASVDQSGVEEVASEDNWLVQCLMLSFLIAVMASNITGNPIFGQLM